MMNAEKRRAPIDVAAAFSIPSACANGFCGMLANIHFSSSGMFGSLKVTALPMRSPRCFAARSAVAHEVIRRGGVLPARRAPRSSAGVVKCQNVTAVREPVLVARREHAPVVIERGAWNRSPVPARCAPIRSRTGTRSGRERRPARCPPGTDGRSRRHRRTARRTSTASCARAPTASLLMLLPSTWCAAVAAPQRNPSGNALGAVPAAASETAALVCRGVIARPAAAIPVERNVLLVNSFTVVSPSVH